MFDIGWGKIVLIGIVALLVIGPKELPAVLRTLGQWMAKLRRMASEFQGQFQEAMREAEMTDLKKQVDEMTSEVQSYANFDPVSEVRKEFESTQQQIENAISGQPPLETSSPPATAESQSPEAQSPEAHTSSSTTPPSAEPAGAPTTDAQAAEPAAAGADTHDAGGKPA
jgi:sec-independent protein translocase protein TatB